MKSRFFQMLCRLLVVTMLSLSFQAAHAGMIGADQVSAAGSAQADREAVLRILSRSEVSSQFQSLGMDAKTATERVAAMTDEEVRTLNGKLQSLPAGANGDWGWLVAVIVIGAIVWFFWGWKSR